MERQPHGTNGISETRRVSYRTTEELGTGNQVNERSIEEYEKVVQQEKIKPIRIEDWRKYVVGKQKYPIK